MRNPIKESNVSGLPFTPGHSDAQAKASARSAIAAKIPQKTATGDYRGLECGADQRAVEASVMVASARWQARSDFMSI